MAPLLLALAAGTWAAPPAATTQPATQPAIGGVARALDRLKAVPKDSFRFLVLGDSQFISDAGFADIVKQAQSRRADLALQVGDLIPADQTRDRREVLEMWALYQRQLAPLAAPFLPVPGNHDLGTTPAWPVWKDVWGPLYYAFDYGRCRFIVLNVQAATDGDGLLGREQADWLKKQLQPPRRPDNVFVFLHQPLWLWSWDAWKPLHELFAKSNVRAVFGGHTHIYDYQRTANIDYIVTVAVQAAPANFQAGLFPHLIEVDVTPDAVRPTILYQGRNLPLNSVDPAVQQAHLRWNLTFQPAAPEQAERYVMKLVNPLDQPIRFDYRWDLPGPDGIAVSPASGSIELAGEQEGEFALKVERGKGEPSALPRVVVQFDVKSKAGKIVCIEKSATLDLPMDLAALKLADRLAGRIVLVGPEYQQGVGRLLERFGLKPGEKLLRVETPEQLDALWPKLKTGDIVVAAHRALEEDDPPLADWFRRNHGRVMEFVESGGSLIACLGRTEKSRAVLANFGVGYREHDRHWRAGLGGDNSVLLFPGKSNPLGRGLIDSRLDYHHGGLFDGSLAPAGSTQPDAGNAWKVLARDNVGMAVIIARQAKTGLIVFSSAVVTAPYQLSQSYNQQRLWANLLTLDTKALRNADFGLRIDGTTQPD